MEMQSINSNTASNINMLWHILDTYGVNEKIHYAESKHEFKIL